MSYLSLGLVIISFPTKSWFIIVMQRINCNHHSVVGLEWAGPGVGGGVVFPFSVSVGLALELLLSDVLVGVSLSGLLLDGGGFGGGDGDEGEEE